MWEVIDIGRNLYRAYVDTLSKLAAQDMKNSIVDLSPAIAPPQQNEDIIREQTLWDKYRQKLDVFLKELGISEPPVCFKYPHLFFYCKGNNIYTIDSFPYGKDHNSHLLAQKTFPSFMVNVCMHPCNSANEKKACSDLYFALMEYLLERPKNELQEIAEMIRAYSPILAAYFDPKYNNQVFYISKEGNLLFDLQSLQSGIPTEYQRLHPLFLLIDEMQANNMLIIPPRLQKLYFMTLLDAHKHECRKKKTSDQNLCNEKQSRYSIPEIAFPLESLLFLKRRQHNVSSVEYVPERDSYSYKQHPLNLHVRNLKTMDISSSSLGAGNLDCVEKFLDIMCGESVYMIDQLAIALSSIMAPSSSGLTVFYSPQNCSLLESTLAHIYKDCIISFKKRKSLTQLTTKTTLHDLYVAQELSHSVVFVKDTVPSEKSIKILRKLLKGKDIPIMSAVLPPQHYCNHLHFVCVTDDREKAAYMKKCLKAQVIDFSSTEKTEPWQPEYSDGELNWFRIQFASYGLKLKKLQQQNIPDPNPFPSTADTLVRNIENEMITFLQNCCSVEKEAFCNTHEIYDQYKRFVQLTYPNQQPLWTKGKFNKQLRAELNRSYKKVVYKRDRRSRKTRSLYGYAGLKLLEIPIPAPKPAMPVSNTLSKYLEHINRYEINIPDALKVMVTSKKKDSQR